MEILAHRGLPFEYPENTRRSLEEALRGGFGIETDIRRTGDGYLVLCHDENIKRGTGVDLNIRETTLNVLKRLSFRYSYKREGGVGERYSICAFDELIELYKRYNNGRKVAIHVKTDEAVGETLHTIANVIISENLQDLFFVFDLTLETAADFKKEFPGVNVSISIGEKRYAPSIYLLEDVKGFKFFDSIWADEWVGQLYTEDFFAEVKAWGKEVYAISPELHIPQGHPLGENGYENMWERLLEWGVDGICTDRPKRLNALMAGSDR